MLVNTNQLNSQNVEKEKRAAELLLVNKELAFQNEEKEKRAAELLLANKELAFQNEEKDKRADELVLANELKEQRANELILTNKELAKSQKEIIDKENLMIAQSRQAAMGEMISMIAHQWRQPLASISAISGTLTFDVITDNYEKNFFQERLESIGELSQHLSKTIDDFRGFFKDDKEEKISKIRNIIDDSITIIDLTLISKNINLSVEYIDTPTIKGHLNELKQVILNLLKNAEDILLENNIQEAKIWIKVYVEDSSACISIEDNAGGVPEEIMDKVFDPYFSTKKEKEGIGLGLYMSKTIIEEHYGGKLLLQNTNNGASFTIKIPLFYDEGE